MATQMLVTGPAVGTSDAADRLGVSVRQVQRWVASGDLTASRTVGGALLIDARSLTALMRARPTRGRAWSPQVAWAALWIASGGEVPVDVSNRTLSRVAEHLGQITAEQLVLATRRRSAVTQYRASASFYGDIVDAVVLTGGNAVDTDQFRITRRTYERVDGYCTQETALDLIERAHLVADVAGSVTLRVPRAASIVEAMSGGRPPIAVVAADLAASYDARERSEGLSVLRELLGSQ